MVDRGPAIMFKVSKKISLFLFFIFIFGSLGILSNSLIPYWIGNKADFNIKGLAIILIMAIVLAGLFTMRMVFTPEGHYGILAITWKGHILKTFFKTPLRRWKDCIVDLEFGWPLYALNIRENEYQFPALIKHFIAGYEDACVYILKYGREADIKPKALEHLQRIAKKRAVA